MTDVTPLIPAERQVIQGYGDGMFRISGIVHEGSVIVLPERTLAWGIAAAGAITLESLEAVTNAEPEVEVLLLGCGASSASIGRALRTTLKQHRIAVEIMDTGAACRTYNVLLSEERRVAAALIAVR